MIRCESRSSASLPKVMHPRHNSETMRPVFPKRRYSINVRFPFFFVPTIVPNAPSQYYTYEQRDSEAMEAEVRAFQEATAPASTSSVLHVISIERSLAQ